MAAPSVRSVATGAFGTSGTITANAPTRALNDILIYIVASSGTSAPTHSTPTDYQSIGTAVSSGSTVFSRISVFWKRCTGASETIPSCTVTPTGTTAAHHFAGCISVQDCREDGDPFENARTNQANGASSLAHTRVISGNNRLSFLCTHHADNVATAVTENAADAYTSRYATDNSTGIDGFTSVFTFPRNTVNDTVTVSFTSGGTGVDIAGVAFALLGELFLRTEEETVTASDEAAYAVGGVGEAFGDDQVESATASDVLRFRQEADLWFPVETITATDSQDSTLVKGSSELETTTLSDDAAYTYAQGSGTGTLYQDEQSDSAAPSDVEVSVQRSVSFELDSVTATDTAVALQRHRAGQEEDDTAASETQAARQRATSTELEPVTASEQEASQQKGTSTELESATGTDNAAYTWAGGAGALEDEQVESVTVTFDASFTLEAVLEVPDEVITATEVQGSRQAARSSELESTSASDNAAYTWSGASGTLYLEAQGESATATDSQASSQAARSFQSDSAVATDTWQAYGRHVSSEIEAVTASDDYGFTLARGGLTDTEVESVSATDTYAYALQGSAAQVESATLSDRGNAAVPIPTFANSFFVWNGAGWV